MQDLDAKLEKVKQLTETGYKLEIGKYISEAWEIFKDYPFGFIGFSFISACISAGLGNIPVVGTLINAAISPALGIGIVLVAQKIKHNQPFQFSDFFKGFEKMQQLAIVGILSTLLLLAAFVCLIIPGIYLAVSYGLINMFAYFLYDGNNWETMERCRKFASKQWFDFFLFFLLLGLLNLGGVLMLVVGVFVTLPLSVISLYVCYESIIGTGEEKEGSSNFMNDLYPNQNG